MTIVFKSGPSGPLGAGHQWRRMRFDIKAMAIVISTTLAAACSGVPPKTLAAANNAPAAAPAPAVAPASAVALADKVDASLVKAGYSPLIRHGQVLYCRSEIITGQRIATRVCLTAAQLQSEQQEVGKAKDILNHPSYNCLGASCNN
jgi:hypothetical protein